MCVEKPVALAMTDIDVTTQAFTRWRPELVNFATRLVTRREVAEELVQEAALKLLSEVRPPESEHLRAWLFRVVSNLAIDHLRRHSTWREESFFQLRRVAEGSPEFVSLSEELRGSPEVAAIASEHLIACFACTLRNLRPYQAAALLLREVQELSVAETATALDATTVQVKNWLQEARQELSRRYATTCALVTKRGVCHQCVELDGFFNGLQRNPLDGTDRGLDARLEILRRFREARQSFWHEKLFKLLDDVIGD